MNKNINAQVFAGDNTRSSGEILFTIYNNIIYSGDSRKESDKIELKDSSKMRAIKVEGGGKIFSDGGFFGSYTYYPSFNESKQTFYTGSVKTFSSNVKIIATISYDRASDKLSITEDSEFIKNLSILVEEALQQKTITSAANDNEESSAEADEEERRAA